MMVYNGVLACSRGSGVSRNNTCRFTAILVLSDVNGNYVHFFCYLVSVQRSQLAIERCTQSTLPVAVLSTFVDGVYV